MTTPTITTPSLTTIDPVVAATTAELTELKQEVMGITDKQQFFTQLPSMCMLMYQSVSTIIGLTDQQKLDLIQQSILTVVQSSTLLTPVDVTILENVLTFILPTLATLLPQVEAAVVEVEEEAVGCLTWLWRKILSLLTCGSSSASTAATTTTTTTTVAK